jgi:D-glycero-D-manno-heptose 1,7-bisphosphate phosphatase
LDKSVLQNIKETKFSLENKILSKLIEKNKVIGYKKKFFFYDIGTKTDFINAKKKLLGYLKRPAIFLDRDNTINADSGYTYKYNNFKFINNSYKALKNLSKKNIYIFIITNQGGIAKGYFSENDFKKLHIKLKYKFMNDNIYINEVKYCPYHPNSKLLKFKKKSQLRKPGNLMIKQISKKFNIDKKNSIMIGDHIKDKKCAEKSKLKFQFVEKNLLSQIKNYF